ELPGLRAGPRFAHVRGRGRAGGVGPAADSLPDGALRPRLPGAGLGGRLRGLLANGDDPDRAGLRPQPGVDDLAGRRRLADAGFRGPIAWPMKAWAVSNAGGRGREHVCLPSWPGTTRSLRPQYLLRSRHCSITLGADWRLTS